jgi:hypothetical protein
MVDLQLGLMRGATVAWAAVFGSEGAAISVTRPGAQPSMPTFAEVQPFLNERLGEGRPSFAVETSPWRKLSDRQSRKAATLDMGIDLGREPAPDETTLCRLRHS